MYAEGLKASYSLPTSLQDALRARKGKANRERLACPEGVVEEGLHIASTTTRNLDSDRC